MRYINERFHTRLFRTMLAGFLLAITVELPTAYADTKAELIGSWVGAIIVDNVPIGIDLTIQEVKVNNEGGEIHYGEPRACRLAIVYTTMHESYYWFSLKNSTGGFCDKLESGRLKLKLKDSNHLTFETTSKAGTVIDSGELEK